MIHRLVKLTFKEPDIKQFQALFDARCVDIRSFPGCKHLELWQDQHDARVFFTYSHWDSEEALEGYRRSKLFKEVWKQTKVLFDDRPMAWSLDSKVKLNKG